MKPVVLHARPKRKRHRLLKGVLVVLFATGLTTFAIHASDSFSLPEGGFLAALNAYPITVSTWVKTGVNDATRRYILNKYNFPNGYVINLLSGKIRTWYLTGNSVTDYVYDGSEGMSSKAVVSDNQWHLVTFTVDAAGGKLYIDGTLEDSMAWTGTPQATSNTEGIRWSAVVTGGDKIAASLDETRIYNRALTSAEIQNLYLKGR